MQKRVTNNAKERTVLPQLNSHANVLAPGQWPGAFAQDSHNHHRSSTTHLLGANFPTAAAINGDQRERAG
jgi:hypothetical protein